MKPDDRAANRLAGAASAYLRQHADNPVHWQPWDAAAFGLARALGRPVLLSIGYSACHWCHVMARESFADPATAAAMNDLFVNIKVDREERPDLDRLFLDALARMDIRAGWPLTAFLTPAGEPYFGGGYYPPVPAFGLPAFTEVLEQAAARFHADPAGAAERARATLALLTAPRRAGGSQSIGPALVDRVAHDLARRVDWLYGGFGIQAPKFLQAGGHEILLRAWARTGEAGFLDAARDSLARICDGGVYDHLGGGFHRYAVDDRWLAPHFEKMLCDNALMIGVLTALWQATHDSTIGHRVAQTIGWLLREMRLPGGAFAASLAAAGDDGEGVFYTWAPGETAAVLGDGHAAFAAVYDESADGPFGGRGVIHRRADAATTAAAPRDALTRLWRRRESRPPPARDDKVLADWNGLAIAALAEAGLAFDRPDWIDAARQAFAATSLTLWAPDGLRHSSLDSQPGPPGFLEDYANMARAALALFEASGDDAFAGQAQAWVDRLDGGFWDEADGGYFLSQASDLPADTRQNLIDETAAPAGNGTMLGVLARLAVLAGEDRYRRRAEGIARRFADRIGRASMAAATALNNGLALDWLVQIVIVGDAADPATAALVRAVATRLVPDRLLIRAAATHDRHPAFGKTMLAGRPTAYVCAGPMCLPPVTDPAKLGALLARVAREENVA